MKTPRLYQTACAEALFEDIQTNKECHPIAALPTGSGKTMVLCEFIDLFMTHKPLGRVLILSHVKEILQQNYNALEAHFDGFEIGLYSSGLDSKTIKRITVAGIQSVFRSPNKFKDVDVVIIDECHLVDTREQGMYRKFLGALDANYVGLTATPFRTGHGYVHIGSEALFNKLSFSMCDIDGFKYLIDQGYLCPLVAKRTNMKLNTDGLGMRMNEYVTEEMSKKFDRHSITNKAVKEIIEFGESYKKWLVFAIDITHAEHIAEELRSHGITTACVHSKMEDDRDEILLDSRRGKYKCIVNVDILTTGYDDPEIDLIAMLRPTQSPILHIQSLGRGMRISPGKDHCLVLDFAGNVMRLGPINDVEVKQKGDPKGDGVAKMKSCPKCQGYLHLAAKVCEWCGYEYPVVEKIMPTASTAEIIRTVKDPVVKVNWFDVSQVFYKLHRKEGKPDMMRVSYSTTNNKMFHEFICYEHQGWVGHKAQSWVKFRSKTNKLPFTTSALVSFALNKNLREPKSILVNESGQYPEIKNVRF